MASDTQRDTWYDWLQNRRYGNDAAAKERHYKGLAGVRDKIITAAQIQTGNVVLDLGTGDGFIAAAALDCLGGNGTLIFSDISTDNLEYCRALAAQLQPAATTRFVQADAQDLSAVPEASIDVIVCRAVIMYTADKERCFREMFRVLKLGGRFSICETINRFGHLRKGPQEMFGCDISPVADIAAKLGGTRETSGVQATDVMIDFDERDLLDFAERAGFRNIQLSFEAAIRHGMPVPWDFVYKTAPNPLAQSLEELLRERLSPHEQHRFTEYLKDVVESKGINRRTALAFLCGHKEG